MWQLIFIYIFLYLFLEMFHLHSVLPEKVHFAVELSVPGKALLGEVAAAFAALDALGVPGSVQHVEEEPVQDGPFAPGAVDHHVSDLEDAECRPSQPDCASRAGTTAEQRFGCRRCAVRRKSPRSSRSEVPE